MTIRDAERANRRLAMRFARAALGKFAFGYALVELREVRFYAQNRSPGAITARAVPSVTACGT